jgi:RNA polymerase sigma-70 factor (ECF subfamily)
MSNPPNAELTVPLQTNVQYTNTTDEELVSLYLKSRNSAFFDMIYKRYSGKVYGRCLSLLKNEAQAQDAVQEVFIKILINLAKFNEQSRLSTWIYSITYNYCIDRIRKHKKNRRLFAEQDIEGLDVEEEVEDNYILEIEVHRLKLILEKIAPDDKAVLMMKYQDEMSIKEMVVALNKSESAIKMKIKRAKHRFRRVYDENYKSRGNEQF